MLPVSTLGALATALCASFAGAVPTPQENPVPAAPDAGAAASSFWLADIDHSKETAWMNGNDQYKIFRNVRDYGAGNGGPDSDAINRAISEGDRCGGDPAGNCDSSTVTPAIIYFPPGDYIIDKPIEMYYYTQLVGDANNRPVLKGTRDFEGMALLDADPYVKGVNWFTNQNNFFRQVRNFVIDVSPVDDGLSGAGIHWQVAQATSLQNIKFIMDEKEGTEQSGIFMDNGSGGFFSDLEFVGGRYGAFLGSQQFTTRNLVFRNCKTAIFMNWNWGWLLHNVSVTGASTGLDMANGPENQTVGSVILSDSRIEAQYGVRFAYKNDETNVPAVGGTLILDNVDMQSVTGAAVANANNGTVLAGGSVVKSWASGHGYDDLQRGPQANRLAPQKTIGAVGGPKKAPGLLKNGNIFSRSKPQYEGRPATDFLSAKTSGCRGDGETDDTNAMNNFLATAARDNKIAYFEHGAYLVKNTIKVPPTAKIVGSIWSLILADGPSFNDPNRPKVVFQIGSPDRDEDGAFEMQDIMFETKGAAPGAIMIEYNLRSEQGASGMWDTHVRIGGSAGTGLEGPENLGGCRKNPNITAENFDCQGVFLMFHATRKSSNVYLENTWFWVSDHDLDNDQPKQVTIYSARGVLIQSRGPVWLWGAASEHSTIYNWQIDGVSAVFSGFTQSETPYYQPNPPSDTPFDFKNVDPWYDPTFAICGNGNPDVPCRDAWGLRILNSRGVLLYGMGLYSFFNNYDQECVPGQNCQENMIRIQGSEVDMYAVSTKAAVNMIVDDRYGTVKDIDNRSNFCATLSYYFTSQ